MASITIEGATRIFADGTRALDHVDLKVADGEFLVLVGPSGCGKSTLLRALAGLERLDSGRVFIGDVDVTQQAARARDIAMVFQNYALYPQMTVSENLEFGLKARKLSRSERRARVAEVARLVGLEALLARRPGELSGGQRQRVAMGRAIARRPKVFLMDEPLSNLDARLRETLRTELSRMHTRLGVTTVYVTHDQVEAMTLGNRVAVMNNGLIQQCDTPRRLFDQPLNLFVAAFIGSPPMNLLPAQVAAGSVRIGSWLLPLPSGQALSAATVPTLIAGIRPSDFSLDANAPADWPRIDAVPAIVEEFGHERIIRFRPDDATAEISALLSGRGNIGPGVPIRLAVNINALHFFDSASGRALQH